MNNKQAIKTLSAIALATLVAACGSAPQGQGASMQSSAPAAQAAPTLQTHDWDLTAAFDARGQAAAWTVRGQAPLRLHFDAQQLSVQNLCNSMGAGYVAQGGRLQVNRAMSTMRACADRDLMQLEQRVGAQLPQMQRYELRGGGAAPVLVVHFADGSRWELAGKPTPATQYGSAGERMFLEVAPERVACNHPLMPNAQCLRVREVRFGDNGVRQSAGAWYTFQGDIQGYQHERGIRNVLRVQRYPFTKPGQPQPADAPSHAYVLDMVVESERAR